jgi:prevent-host-death family protein
LTTVLGSRVIQAIMPIRAVARRRAGVVKKVAAMKVRDNLGQLLNEVYFRGDEVVIERAGKAMAVLVPVGRYEQYQRERQERFKVLDRIRARTKKIPTKVLDATINEAVRAVRARG